MNINMKTVKSKFLHRALVLVNAYKTFGAMKLKFGTLSVPNFNFVAP